MEGEFQGSEVRDTHPEGTDKVPDPLPQPELPTPREALSPKGMKAMQGITSEVPQSK